MRATGRLRRSAAAALLVAFVLCAVGPAPAAVEPEPVVTGPRSQLEPFANDTYVAYTIGRATEHGQNAIAESIDGGEVTRLNESGTYGAVQGIDPGTNRVIYLQQPPWRGAVYSYDLDTGVRRRIPEMRGFQRGQDIVNARISSRFILLEWVRLSDLRQILELHDRRSGAVMRIGAWSWQKLLSVGSVGDRHATYVVGAADGTSRLFLYDSQTDSRQRIPTTEGTRASMPLVDEANSSVYFAEDGACGESSDVIWRLPLDLGGEPTEVAQLPDTMDLGLRASLTANAVTAHTDLYVELGSCQASDSDIYVLRAVDAEPTT